MTDYARGFRAGIEAAAAKAATTAGAGALVGDDVTRFVNGIVADILALAPAAPEPSGATTSLVDAVKTGRQRELQAIGAGISKRDLHAVETAYNQLRDRLDAALIAYGRAPAAPEPSEDEKAGVESVNVLRLMAGEKREFDPSRARQEHPELSREVERVAAFIMGQCDPVWAQDEWPSAPEPLKDYYRDVARAALAAGRV